jgi:hypothetical protein
LADRETLTLTIHGLPAFNKDVDGEVFARKFFKFMQALAVADDIANGGRRLKYLIEKLEKNTATAAVREQVVSGTAQHASGVDFFQKAANLIYHDSPKARELPVKLIRYVEELASGAGQEFERGEIKWGANDNFVRIDKNLGANANRVIADIRRASLGEIRPFAGVANISLDGTVITLEGRGETDKAVVKLTAGGKEIDCLLHRISDEKMRQLWKQRCTVVGVGHYSGNGKLPDYIEAVSIDPVGAGVDWKRWKGAFNPIEIDEGDWN